MKAASSFLASDIDPAENHVRNLKPKICFSLIDDGSRVIWTLRKQSEDR
jgi:hypothetical protein